MTGEAQCEERKRTLAWHRVHTHFTPHRQCAEVMFRGPIWAVKTRPIWLPSHIFFIWSLKQTTRPISNNIILQHFYLLIWQHEKKHMVSCIWTANWQRYNMNNVRVQETILFLLLCIYRSYSLVRTLWDWAWIPISQEKPKWSIITSSKLPLFPFQHHTELRYQLTHYPLSPGDW